MKLLFTWLLCIPVLGLAQVNSEPVQEFYVFEVPGLAKTGPAFVSYFFVRGETIWGFGETLPINKIDWPAWDKNSIPVNLVPVPRQKASILIYDSAYKLIQELELKEPFSPERYFESVKIKPAFYKLKIQAMRSHLELISPFYPWYHKKKVVSCSVDASAPNFELKKSSQWKACLSTLRAYTDAELDESRQFYLHLDWPLIRGRENIMAAKDAERDIRSGARKRKMVFQSTKGKGGQLFAEVGLTQKETLPVITLTPGQLKDMEMAQQSPDTKKVTAVMYDKDFADGSGIKVLSFYSDAQAERHVVSPKVGNYQIALQIIEGGGEPHPEAPVRVVQTRSYERRTGFLGFLRPFQVMFSGAYNQLTSSRSGEASGFLGLPTLEARYNWQKLGIQPYFSFEKDLVHFGSTLEITEMRLGASRRLPWIEGLFYSVGYQEYSLAGKNPGIDRLGGIDAFTLGIGASQRFENWALRERVDFLFGNSQSFDTRFDAGRFFGSTSDSRYYLGAFLGYANYRGYVVNRLKTRELFTEDRLQIGLSVGWIGPDSF